MFTNGPSSPIRRWLWWIRQVKHWRCPSRKKPAWIWLYEPAYRKNKRRTGRRAARRDLPCTGTVGEDGTPHYVTADEYLSGNVRRKLRQAQRAAQQDPVYAVNVEALTAAQPKDLDASEIEVRLGATWIDKDTSSSLCTRPSTPRFISSAVSRSTIRPLPLNGRSRGNLPYPTTMWQLHHLRNQPCQCLQDFGGQPEPAGCPYL